MNKCPHYIECGGCNYLDIPYEEEIKEKVSNVNSLFKKNNFVFTDIIYNENYNFYRNKVHLAFKMSKTNKLNYGIYEEGTKNIISIDSCYLHAKEINNISPIIKQVLSANKILPFTEKNGILKYVVIRYGFQTKELMVIIVTSDAIFPGRKNVVTDLLKKVPQITTIIQNINPRITPVVLGDEERILYGRGYIEDIICGLTFRISSKSFFQINPHQTEKLYQRALEFANLDSNDIVLDVYSGIGTIGLLASKYCKSVICIENNPQAVADAKINARKNKIENVIFYCEDSTKYLAELINQKNKIDCLFLDPPRSGTTKEFIRIVNSLKIPKIIYISCNPETLQRDLEDFSKNYKIEKGALVDMFSRTKHLECVCHLSLK